MSVTADRPTAWLAQASTSHYQVSRERRVPAAGPEPHSPLGASRGQLCAREQGCAGWMRTHRRASDPNARVSVVARRAGDPRCTTVPLERENTRSRGQLSARESQGAGELCSSHCPITLSSQHLCPNPDSECPPKFIQAAIIPPSPTHVDHSH